LKKNANKQADDDFKILDASDLNVDDFISKHDKKNVKYAKGKPVKNKKLKK
jgi:hypothetical protein